MQLIGFVYDYLSPSPVPGLVSPFMENGTALEYISKNPTVDRFRLVNGFDIFHGLFILNYVIKVLGVTLGLCYLHSRNPPVVHGDLRAVCLWLSP